MTDVTNYLPIVHAEHDDNGDIISVEIDWADSMPAVEQNVDEETANELSKKFDDWLAKQPQATGYGHWKWTNQ